VLRGKIAILRKTIISKWVLTESFVFVEVGVILVKVVIIIDVVE
jgi:hypothetical protein